MSQISARLSQVLEQKEATVFQRLREWYLDAHHKRGDHRRELEGSHCFAPLVRWIVQRWAGEERRLALALDATSLGDRWTVRAISVLVRGCAIPVAWKVLRAHAKGSWRPYWEALLKRLQGSVPVDWQVLVLGSSRPVCPLALCRNSGLWVACVLTQESLGQGTCSGARGV